MSHGPVVALRSVELFTVDLPLAQPFRHASSGRIDVLEELVVKLTTQDGAVGWGEVRGNAAYVTGETRNTLIATLTDLLIPALLTGSPRSPAAAARWLRRAAPNRPAARALLDAAMHDVAARQCGLSAQALLGAGDVSVVPVHGTVPFCPPEEAAARVRAYLDRGISTVKLRVGLPSLDDDLARLDAVRSVLRERTGGGNARLAADANQGWTAAAARRALTALAPYDLAWVEQPVAARDLESMVEIRRGAAMPIFADESAGTLGDLLSILALGAADGVHLKLVKAGGMADLLAMAAVAEARGMPYLVGQMDEGQLATAAALHAAAALAPLSCELWGFQRVGWQPFSGLAMTGGGVNVPGPGLGISVDEASLTPVLRRDLPA